MEHGQVRTILWRHLAPDGPAAGSDPTTLVPASRLRQALDGLSPADQRQRAADFVALWARTFRTLVSHLRGRPERALALFADEVYPFLRGDRRAARVERVSSREAKVLLADDLPAPYLAGLVQEFLGLSGAQAQAEALGGGLVQVRFSTAPADRLARLSQTLALLRLPLLACAAIAALTGIALAATSTAVDPLRALAVLVGAVAAQAAANAQHERTSRKAGGPLRPGLPRRAWTTLAAAFGLVALACAAFLVPAAPAMLVFVAAGLALGLASGPLFARGLGPAVAVLIDGPVIALGAFHAFPVGAHHLLHAGLGLLTLPFAVLVAALLFLDDLADRPLDEAGGKRTLAVRLPRGRHLALYAALVGLGLLGLASSSFVLGPLPAFVAGFLAVPALLLCQGVARHLDDPHALAPARLWTLALALAVGLAMAASLALAPGGFA